MMNSETLRINRWLVLVILAGLVLRAAAIIGYNHLPDSSDELAYRSMALNLINGKGIVDHMGNYAMYNAGYPLFILAPAFFLFGDNLLAVRLFNLVLGGISIALCYIVAKEAGAGKIGRLLAALIWALYLPASVYCVYIAKENLMIPLMLGVIWCTLRLRMVPSARLALGCGVLFGLLALTGNAALVLAGAVVFALLVATSVSVQKRLTYSVLILAVAIAIAAPWVIRNSHVIGASVLNTNGGFNLYLGNNPAATGMFVSIADTPRGSTWQALRSVGEVRASEVLKNEAILWIKAHPSEFMGLAIKKLAYFWMPPIHGSTDQSTIERLIRNLWAIQFIALIVAALGGLACKQLRTKELAILWLSIAFYSAVHMLFYVIFRYRVPIMPLLGILAASTVEIILIKKIPSLRTFGTVRMSGS
jgi:4-amino-4-deoxy-L-arabinose transferase-like glycosyltransferase